MCRTTWHQYNKYWYFFESTWLKSACKNEVQTWTGVWTALPAIPASSAAGSLFTSWELTSAGLVHVCSGFWTHLLLLRNCFAALLASLPSRKDVGACSKSKEQLCSAWLLPRGHWSLREVYKGNIRDEMILYGKNNMPEGETHRNGLLSMTRRKVCDTLIVKL